MDVLIIFIIYILGASFFVWTQTEMCYCAIPYLHGKLIYSKSSNQNFSLCSTSNQYPKLIFCLPLRHFICTSTQGFDLFSGVIIIKEASRHYKGSRANDQISAKPASHATSIICESLTFKHVTC